MGPTKEQIDFVRQNIASQLEAFSDRRRRNKRKAFTARLGGLAVGAVTTILLGLSIPGYEVLAKNVALALSAAGTLLAAWESFFNHRELWIRYTATCMRLHALLSELEYLTIGAGPSQSDLDALFARFHSVLDETNEQWKELRSQKQAGSLEALSVTHSDRSESPQNAPKGEPAR